MARFMLAWELGGGLGHSMPLARLADALLRRGHQVDVVLKDLSTSRRVLGALLDNPNLGLWQAPVWLPRALGLPEPASYPELMVRAGYLDAGALLGLALAWRQLFRHVMPDLLLADHAPTALLAARGTAMRSALYGSAFVVPPARHPMPAYRDWEPAPAGRLESAEAQVLACCNAVLSAFGQPPLPTLHALFDCDEAFALGWPELDHFATARGGTSLRHWGWFAGIDVPASFAWPSAHSARIVGYLQREHPAIDAALAALRAGPGHTVLYLAGMSQLEARAAGSDHLTIVTRPLDLTAALQHADLLLCHGGIGSVYEALQAGVPAVLLPLHAEQLLFARRVVSTGAGVLLWPEEVGPGLQAAIRAVLASPGFRTAALALAARHPGDALPAIVDRCEVLVAVAAAAPVSGSVR